MCVAACTALPKTFMPQTPEEQAVAYTVTTFLSAWHARDVATLTTLVLPDATIDAFVDGSPVPPAPILLVVQQRPDDSPLLQASADHLVDFRQSSSSSVSVGTYVHDLVRVRETTDEVTTRIRWDLVQRDGQWHIQHIAQTTWVVPYYVRGSGP
jgi:hypothetical protein